MRREPSLTFDGALRILGKHEHKTIEKIDKLLGGVILGGGAAAGLVALGATPLAPLAAFGLVWGWAEQKGLAVELLKSAVNAVSGRVSGLRGLEKRELIAAAHSTIVAAALFESLRDYVDKELYSQLKLTDEKKIALINLIAQETKQDVVGALYAAEIPVPSAARGFEENARLVATWQASFSDYLRYFISGFTAERERAEQERAEKERAEKGQVKRKLTEQEQADRKQAEKERVERERAEREQAEKERAEQERIAWAALMTSSIERYRSYYLALAAKVPEFAIWAQLGEHAATRAAVGELGDEVDTVVEGLAADVAELSTTVEGLDAAVRESNANVVAALNTNRDTLNRITALLAVGLPGGTDGDGAQGHADLRYVQLPGIRTAVSWANAAILGEAIIPADPDRYPAELTIPRVSDIYVNPRYRVARFDNRAYPANDSWWDGRVPYDDFDVLLARHVTSPDATRLPLLLLGHPGAGKSLLTKVFAARLPASEYIVVRVPLRRVSADSRILRQIEEALEISTDQRIAWSDLAAQSADTIRVVLLDGLDELLQASGHDRSAYLEDIVDFQEREANQRRPVVVIVTSRTVVADRVRIPDGTTIVKLEPFSDDDITDWVVRWTRVNADAIAAGTIGELTPSAARRQPGLAEQPLLLLMLALYAADRTLPPLDEEMETAELYRRLLEGFARREAAKELGLGHDPSPADLDQRIRNHLERLAIAALGMFNRGRQDISEAELAKDLEVLAPQQMERSRPGQRIVGEFFFVYAPEARTLDGDEERNGQPRRAYEFLHATFGEYLVARRVIDAVVEVTGTAFTGLRGRGELHDDMLFALLSHQVLAARRSMLDFASEIFAVLPDDARPQVLETLEQLLSTCRNRRGADWYTAYRPVSPDQVHQLACYSANLVALRCLLEPDPRGVPVARLIRTPHGELAKWRGTPNLWNAGLDVDGLQAMLTLLAIGGEPPRLRVNTARDLSFIPLEISLARLIRDNKAEKRLRYGTAISDRVTYFADGDSWGEVMSSWLIAEIAGEDVQPMFEKPPEGTPQHEIVRVAHLIFHFLRHFTRHPATEDVLRLLFSLPPVFDFDAHALTSAVIYDPNLRNTIPQLADHEIYGEYERIVRRIDSPKALYRNVEMKRVSDANIAAILAFVRKK
jgi:hypothetical protein